MFKKLLLVAVVLALAIPLAVPATAQDDKPMIGFLPGVRDPF